MSSALRTRLTPEQYLTIERAAEFRSEYYDGQMAAMAGTTRWHNRIVMNLGLAIGPQLRDRPCEVFAIDMRVCVSATGLYTYPDVIVVCGEPRFRDNALDTILDPTVIFEVLSPSTEGYDRGAKFEHYQRLVSLKEYVLVAQDRMLVECQSRRGKTWLLTKLTRPEEVLRLDSIECEVRVRDIYDKVRLALGDSI